MCYATQVGESFDPPVQDTRVTALHRQRTILHCRHPYPRVGGGYVSQIYAIWRAMSKSLVARCSCIWSTFRIRISTGKTLRVLLRDWYLLRRNTSLQVKEARLLGMDSSVELICMKQSPENVTLGRARQIFPLDAQRFAVILATAMDMGASLIKVALMINLREFEDMHKKNLYVSHSEDLNHCLPACIGVSVACKYLTFRCRGHESNDFGKGSVSGQHQFIPEGQRQPFCD